MAEVEAQRVPGPGWLLFLLILFAVAVALAIFAGGRAVRTVPPITAAAEPITQYQAIVDAREKLPLAGRRVVLKDVPVERAAGDRVFWAGKPGRDILVVLEQGTPGSLAPPFRLQPEQTVNITGTVKLVPGTKVRSAWKLSHKDADRAAGQRVYLAAESVEAVQR
mgnify:CR=1 FL=1